jgi:hypothetical protein
MYFFRKNHTTIPATTITIVIWTGTAQTYMTNASYCNSKSEVYPENENIRINKATATFYHCGTKQCHVSFLSPTLLLPNGPRWFFFGFLLYGDKVKLAIYYPSLFFSVMPSWLKPDGNVGCSSMKWRMGTTVITI